MILEHVQGWIGLCICAVELFSLWASGSTNPVRCPLVCTRPVPVSVPVFRIAIRIHTRTRIRIRIRILFRIPGGRKKKWPARACASQVREVEMDN